MHGSLQGMQNALQYGFPHVSGCTWAKRMLNPSMEEKSYYATGFLSCLQMQLVHVPHLPSLVLQTQLLTMKFFFSTERKCSATLTPGCHHLQVNKQITRSEKTSPFILRGVLKSLLAIWKTSKFWSILSIRNFQ